MNPSARTVGSTNPISFLPALALDGAGLLFVRVTRSALAGEGWRGLDEQRNDPDDYLCSLFGPCLWAGDDFNVLLSSLVPFVHLWSLPISGGSSALYILVLERRGRRSILVTTVNAEK